MSMTLLGFLRGLLRRNRDNNGGEGQNSQAHDDIVYAVIAEKSDAVEPANTELPQGIGKLFSSRDQLPIGNAVIVLYHRGLVRERFRLALYDVKYVHALFFGR